MKKKLTIKGLPPSYNQHFKINYRSRQTYLSQAARKYKDKVKLACGCWADLKDDTVYLFKIYVEYWSQWKYKNKNIKKKDLQNLNKILIDAIFEAIGRDDSLVFEITERKMPFANSPKYEGEDKTVFEIEVMDTYVV